MFEKIYRSMNDLIIPDKTLIDHTLETISNETKYTKSKKKPHYRRSFVIASILVLCIFTAIPVLAANVPEIYKLLYLVSPATAQFFMPVQKSCESNGIKMEVVSSYIHGNTAEVYITLQDLTGDRVDETTDLYDSYSINLPFDASASCQRAGYDENTKTATFLIKITLFKDINITGDKITFSLRCFLSDKHKYEDMPIAINLRAVGNNNEIKKEGISGGGGKISKYYPQDENQESIWGSVLVSSGPIYTAVPGIDITAIGYIDDMLHIQTAVINRSKNDNHGFFYLKDKEGNEITEAYSAAFIEYKEKGNEDTRISYDEHVFDIPRNEIGNYNLYGTFFTAGLYTEGSWQVTFPLDENK